MMRWSRCARSYRRATGAIGLLLAALGCQGPSANGPQHDVADLRLRIGALLAENVEGAPDDDPILAALDSAPSLFSGALSTALRADRAAQAQSPGIIVGIDFDPFTASQDPCPEYEVDAPEPRADTVAFPVHPICGGVRSATPVAVFLATRDGEGWVVSDIAYPASQTRLTRILGDLAHRRAASPSLGR